MNESKEFELLKDIARLLVKYGPDTFDALSRLLSKQEFIEQLLEVLNTTSKIGRRSKPQPSAKPSGTRPRKGVDQLLGKLADLEPEKSHLLSTFRDDLLAKNILPSMRDVKAFISDNGLESLSATSREKAIFPLIRSLSKQPLEQVKAIVERTVSKSQGDDRTLEGWANIILKKPVSDNETDR